MAGGEAVGAKLAREGDQVDELHPLVAQRARHRRPPRGIFVGELVDHAGAEAAFVIEHIMGDAEPVADGLGVVDVLPGAARARALHRFAMVVELERDPDHLGAACARRARRRPTESTPPDMATTIRASPPGRSRSKRSGMAAVFTRNSPCPHREGQPKAENSGAWVWRVTKASSKQRPRPRLDLDELLGALRRPPMRQDRRVGARRSPIPLGERRLAGGRERGSAGRSQRSMPATGLTDGKE